MIMFCKQPLLILQFALCQNLVSIQIFHMASTFGCRVKFDNNLCNILQGNIPLSTQCFLVCMYLLTHFVIYYTLSQGISCYIVIGEQRHDMGSCNKQSCNTMCQPSLMTCTSFKCGANSLRMTKPWYVCQQNSNCSPLLTEINGWCIVQQLYLQRIPALLQAVT